MKHIILAIVATAFIVGIAHGQCQNGQCQNGVCPFNATIVQPFPQVSQFQAVEVPVTADVVPSIEFRQWELAGPGGVVFQSRNTYRFSRIDDDGLVWMERSNGEKSYRYLHEYGETEQFRLWRLGLVPVRIWQWIRAHRPCPCPCPPKPVPVPTPAPPPVPAPQPIPGPAPAPYPPVPGPAPSPNPVPSPVPPTPAPEPVAGPAGPQGPVGPVGPAGPQGAPGKDGKDAKPSDIPPITFTVVHHDGTTESVKAYPGDEVTLWRDHGDVKSVTVKRK